MNTPQPNMEYKDIVDKFPDTIKIYPHHIIQVMIEKGIGDFDPSKTWLQMGLDDLMIKKILDIKIYILLSFYSSYSVN